VFHSTMAYPSRRVEFTIDSAMFRLDLWAPLARLLAAEPRELLAESAGQELAGRETE